MKRRHPSAPRQLTIFEGGRDDRGDTDRRVTHPPQSFRPDLKNGLAWCPYCAMTTLFAWDDRLKEPRCPRCSAGAADYYVALINRLDTDDACQDFARGVRRAGLSFERPLFFEK